MYDYRLALQHALEYLPASVAAVYSDRSLTFAECVARTYDRHRESALPISLHQYRLAGYLVT